MPLFLIIVGLLLFFAAINGGAEELGSQVSSDFLNKKMLATAAAIIILGSIGYSKTLRPVSDALLALYMVAFTLNNGGAISKIEQQLN